MKMMKMAIGNRRRMSRLLLCAEREAVGHFVHELGTVATRR